MCIRDSLYAVRASEDDTVVLDASAPRERVETEVLELVDRAVEERAVS